MENVPYNNIIEHINQRIKDDGGPHSQLTVPRSVIERVRFHQQHQVGTHGTSAPAPTKATQTPTYLNRVLVDRVALSTLCSPQLPDAVLPKSNVKQPTRSISAYVNAKLEQLREARLAGEYRERLEKKAPPQSALGVIGEVLEDVRRQRGRKEPETGAKLESSRDSSEIHEECDATKIPLNVATDTRQQILVSNYLRHEAGRLGLTVDSRSTRASDKREDAGAAHVVTREGPRDAIHSREETLK